MDSLANQYIGFYQWSSVSNGLSGLIFEKSFAYCGFIQVTLKLSEVMVDHPSPMLEFEANIRLRSRRSTLCVATTF